MTKNFSPKDNKQAAYQRLSPAEYAAKKQEEKAGVYLMIDEAIGEITESPENFQSFLETQSRVDRYSVANALLIYKQCPNASRLKGYQEWAEDGVQVSKGAKSISILEPVEYTRQDGSIGTSFNVKKVFDVSQTNGKYPAAPMANPDPRTLVAMMIDTAPVKVEAADQLPYPSMGAFYDHSNQTLLVQRDIGNSLLLCRCVAQELGHAHIAMNGSPYNRRAEEFNATCISYMICKKYGIDTRNFTIDQLPKQWEDMEPKEIRAELTKTRKAYSDINTCISEELARKRQNRSKDMER